MFNRINRLLQYTSDLHLEKGYRRIIKPKKPFLVLAGDIGYPEQDSYKDFLHVVSNDFDKVFVISGNHEYDGQKVDEFYKIDEKIENICNMRSNLHYLQKKSELICIKYNISISGCTMWAEYPLSRNHLHLDNVEWLNSLKNTNHVIATHYCPFQKNEKTFKYFGTDQSNIIKKDNVIAWIYGHTHFNKDVNIEGKWLLTNQYGKYEKPLYGYKF